MNTETKTISEFLKFLDTGKPVRFNNTEWKVIKCDMGGKCKIKKLTLPNKGRVLTEIDFTELSF